MKNYFYLSVLVALIMVSCKKNDEAYYHLWEGDYETKETIEVYYADGTKETLILSSPSGDSIEVHDSYTKESPVYIFEDDGLYVQTYGIGNPFQPDSDPANHAVILRAPKRMPKDEGIEDVEPVGPEHQVVLINGGVYTISYGKLYSAKAIEVESVSSDQLVLEDGEKFTVAFTDATGSVIDDFTCHWTYTPIKKLDEKYTWEADLHLSSKIKPGQLLVPTRMHHKLVMRKI